jgi:sialic acid synthase SpsE
MNIGNKQIGPAHPPYIIAEIGVNHDGHLSRALELTKAAAEAGADAVKLQYFVTDRLMSKAAKLAAYQSAAGETDPIAMLRRLELSLNEMAQVVERAHALGIHAIVTVFSTELVGPAGTLPWDAYKTASPDIINKPLLDALAATDKPMIVSTGASTLDEVVRAAGWLAGAGDRLAMLQCVSSYPAPHAALGGIQAIAAATGLPTGYSDHTDSIDTGAAAARAGAVILERHITYDTGAKGPDHAASLTPDRFADYARTARAAHRSAVHIEPDKQVLDCERDVRLVSRQSVVSTRPIFPGNIITREELTIKRPGTGILAYRLEEVLGRTAARSIEADHPIAEADLTVHARS